jgi:hypothetical protein
MARRRFLRGIATVHPAQEVGRLLGTGQAQHSGGESLGYLRLPAPRSGQLRLPHW